MEKYYRALGVDRVSSITEIKAAYRKLAMKYHPDRGGDHKRFCEVNEAWSWIETNHHLVSGSSGKSHSLPSGLRFRIDFYDYVHGNRYSFDHDGNDYSFYVEEGTSRQADTIITPEGSSPFLHSVVYKPVYTALYPEYKPMNDEGDLICNVRIFASEFFMNKHKKIVLPDPLSGVSVKYSGFDESVVLRVPGKGFFKKDLFVKIEIIGDKPNKLTMWASRILNKNKSITIRT